LLARKAKEKGREYKRKRERRKRRESNEGLTKDRGKRNRAGKACLPAQPSFFCSLELKLYTLRRGGRYKLCQRAKKEHTALTMRLDKYTDEQESLSTGGTHNRHPRAFRTIIRKIDFENPRSFRPISLMSFLYKTLEKVGWQWNWSKTPLKRTQCMKTNLAL
jgi:hypothetical protein